MQATISRCVESLIESLLDVLGGFFKLNLLARARLYISSPKVKGNHSELKAFGPTESKAESVDVVAMELALYRVKLVAGVSR